MTTATLSASAATNAARRGNAAGRIALIIGAWLAFALFLLLPLFVVLSEALKLGFGTFFSALLEPDAIAALKLTLLAVGIATEMLADPAADDAGRAFALGLSVFAGHFTGRRLWPTMHVHGD